jgi:hypothetical protein
MYQLWAAAWGTRKAHAAKTTHKVAMRGHVASIILGQDRRFDMVTISPYIHRGGAGCFANDRGNG